MEAFMLVKTQQEVKIQVAHPNQDNLRKAS